MKKFARSKNWFVLGIAALLFVTGAATIQAADDIIHDGEYYFVQQQYAEQWAAEDKQVDIMIAKIRK